MIWSYLSLLYDIQKYIQKKIEQMAWKTSV